MRFTQLGLLPLVLIGVEAAAQDAPENPADAPQEAPAAEEAPESEEPANAPPVVTTVSVSPTKADTTQDVVCKAVATDPEGADVSLSYAWSAGGVVIAGQSASTLPAAATKKGGDLVCTVTPSDGELTGEAKASDPAVIVNTAPTIEGATLAPAEATTASALTCSPGPTADIDGDTVSTTIAWLASGTPLSQTGATLPAEATKKGQRIQCKVTPSDGESEGKAVTSDSVTIANTAPTLASAKVSNTAPLTTDALTCEPGEATDADGDTVRFSYEWKSGDDVVSTSQTLAASLTKKGVSYVCAVTPSDGVAKGEPVLAPAVTVKNSAPALSSVALKPTTAATDVDLTCAPGSSKDADGDEVSLTYAWSASGTPIAGATEAVLPAASTKKGQAITCTVTPGDGAASGEPVASEPVTIQNTAPTVASASLSPEEATVSTRFTCSAGEQADLDGDTVSTQWIWRISGRILGDQTARELGPIAMKKGDTIQCEAVPNDGESGGEGKRSKAVTIANTAPTLASAAISNTAPLTTDSLKCEPGEATDADERDTVRFAYRWLKGEEVVGTSQTLPSSSTSKGDSLVCEVTPTDGVAKGKPVTTSAVTVKNSAPALSSARLGQTSATTATELTCVPGTTSDADRDEVTLSYAWQADGNPIAGATTNTLPAASTKKNQAITCVATPSDGTLSGEAVTSKALSIANTPPVLESVALTPAEPTTTAALTCAPGASSDADGDPVAFDLRWLANGVPIADQTGTTLPAEATKKGQRIQCEATPRDDEAKGKAVRSDAVTVQNTAPVLAKAAIDKTAPLTTDSLTCEPGDASDVDGDKVYFAYAWSVNGTAKGTASTLSSSSFSKGDKVVCEVTPKDGATSGSAVATAAVTVLNSAPKASKATVSPASPKTTDELTCTAGAATDADGDEVSFEYAWQAGGAPIAGATAATLPAAQHKKHQEITCSVVPTDGAAKGEAVTSAAVTIQNTVPELAAVTASPAEPTTTSAMTCAPGAATDADGDTVSYSYAWTASGRTLASTDKTLPADQTAKNQSIVCAVTPSDDDGAGKTVRSEPIKVLNTPPVLASAATGPEGARTTDSLTCTPGEGSDVDNDRLSYSYAWTVNGESAGSNSNRLTSSSFTRDQKVVCEVTPRDGTDDGKPIKAAALTIQNTPPVLDKATLGPVEAYTDTELTCAPGTGKDVDNDEVSFVFAWYVDDKKVGGSGPTLSTSLFKKNQTVKCEASPTDGTDTGEARTSNSVTIKNSAPIVDSVTLGPEAVFTEDTVTLKAVAHDPDGDPVELTYAWTVNGEVVEGQKTTSLSGKEFFDRDDKVVARVTANDGFVDGEIGESEAMVIKNTPPTNVMVFIPDPEGGFVDLRCHIAGASTDLDNDEVSYRFEFTRNGEPYTGPQNQKIHPGDSVPASEVSRDDEWVCKATPTDGTDDGPFSNFTITVIQGDTGGGSSHSCALSTLGQLSCWGLDDYKVASPPEGEVFKRLAVGGWHNCALSAETGDIRCWGHRTYGQHDTPKGDWKEITSGWWHSCALSTAGEISCWGQSADARTEAPSGKFLAVDAGGQHTCAIGTNGSLTCWGSNTLGQTEPPSGSFTAVSSGENHSCALKGDGSVVCWGANESGQTDAPSGRFQRLAMGARHSCAQKMDGHLTCWGLDNFGQAQPPPQEFWVPGKGFGHSCGFDATGSVACWGKSNYNQAVVPSFLIKERDEVAEGEGAAEGG